MAAVGSVVTVSSSVGAFDMKNELDRRHFLALPLARPTDTWLACDSIFGVDRGHSRDKVVSRSDARAELEPGRRVRFDGGLQRPWFDSG